MDQRRCNAQNTNKIAAVSFRTDGEGFQNPI